MAETNKKISKKVQEIGTDTVAWMIQNHFTMEDYKQFCEYIRDNIFDEIEIAAEGCLIIATEK